MARLARKNLDGKYFHIMVQGIGREYVFPDNECKGYYLHCLQQAKQFSDVKLLGFCVMSNHAHILVVADNIQLATFFKRANSDYARYYNRITNRVGYVFRDRYKSQVINDEKYLVQCLAYIQKNPLSANMVEQAEDYEYSSYNNYLTHVGIIDFNEAKKYYSIDPQNIRAIMQETTEAKWIEHDDKVYEKAEDVFQELIEKYDITKEKLKSNDDLTRLVITEMQSRTKASLREIATYCEIARETLRKLRSVPPSPRP